MPQKKKEKKEEGFGVKKRDHTQKEGKGGVEGDGSKRTRLSCDLARALSTPPNIQNQNEVGKETETRRISTHHSAAYFSFSFFLFFPIGEYPRPVLGGWRVSIGSGGAN